MTIIIDHVEKSRRGRPVVVSHKIEDRGYETPCWAWQGNINSKGYGRLRINGVTWKAHRYYYERKIGPIPVGLQLDHLCRVRECVNPEHLEPVTHVEHSRRAVRGRRFTEEGVRRIREAHANGAQVLELARLHGVRKQYMSLIVNRKIWRNA